MLGRGDKFRMSRRVMGVNGMDDILHERAAITAVAIPVIRKQIATLESAGQIVCIKTCEPMSESVDALEEQPPAAGLLTIGLAETIDSSRVGNQDGVKNVIEIGLDHSMVTP